MVLRDGRDGAALEQLFARIVVETTKNRKGSSRADNNSLLDVEDSGESEAVLRTVAKVEEVIAKLKKLKQERMDTFDDLKMKVPPRSEQAPLCISRPICLPATPTLFISL